MKRLHVFFIGAVLIALAILLVPGAMAQNGVYPKVFEPNSVVYGHTYAQWSAAWWQWAQSIPASAHPLFDTADCSVGQSGPVWFLGGQFGSTVPSTASARRPKAAATTTVERRCTIPLGKAIYFPIANISDSAPEEPNWACGGMFPPLVTGTIAEMKKCVETFFTIPNPMYVSVDGKYIQHLGRHYVASDAFSVTWPDDNFLTALGEGPFPAGTYFPVVDVGYYVMLQPLSHGTHTLRWRQGDVSHVYHLTIE